ncbi:unnamed protein product [Microthlaspi erraticum]|uniref:Uncharacterized protein n=1 Tax=Microthlaspi erraticum TaxID=1685480 RepID=A0A6D2JYM1_9BRAS|nr:unnamed protein product [Microthlaspi erraticum]
MKTILQQIIQGQANSALELNKRMVEIHNKVDCSYNDLNNKFESLTTKVLTLEAKVGGSSSSSTKEYCHAVFSTKDGVAETEENERAIEELYRLLHGTSVEISVNEETSQAEKRNAKEEASKIVAREETIKVEPPLYKPEFPFPERVLTKAQKKVVSTFRNDMSNIGVHLPNIGNMQEAHLQIELIKMFL